MDVSVSPQDCLKDRHKTKPIPRSSRRQRSPNCSPPPGNPNLVMGQVKILKRGEVLSFEESNSVSVDSVKRVEPGEIPVEKLNEGIVFYAGSGFVTSPPPSSLPLPAFIKKTVAEIVDHDASCNLMKFLGLNLI